jgi:magnesium transporter
MSDTKYYFISPTGGLTQLASLDEALEARNKNGFIWLEYRTPTKEELSLLTVPLGIHPLAIEDCMDDQQIPKIEDYPQHAFILFNGFDYHDRKISVFEIDLFIGEKFLVTVSGCDEKKRPYLPDLGRYAGIDIENGRQGPAFLAHVLLDSIVDQKFLAVEALEEQLNNTEDLILDDQNKFNPGSLLNLRRELLGLRKSLFHEREILMKICRGDCRFIPKKAILFYRDIYDHLAKFFELTESYREIVTSLMEMYLSMLNNQMSKSANQMNATVRRLTFITTIFMPLTLLAGIGGMSEWSMMTGPQNWRIAYPAFLLGMAVLGIINYFLIKLFEAKSKIK